MKKIVLLFVFLSVALVNGCSPIFLGRTVGTLVRIPLEATEEIIYGFGEGLFGTYHEEVEKPSPPEYKEERTPYRDSEGNIRWQ